MKPEFKILRKAGWDLNPDDKVVNSIIRALERNGGHCPCHSNDSIGHNVCPCSSYTQHNKCHCTLYVLKEVWKDVKGFEEYYEVSSFGKVRSKARTIIRSDGMTMTFTGKELAPYSNKKRNDYCYVYLRVNGKKYPKFVHRLVAEAFLPNPKNLPQVNHKDEDTTNNRLDNLEWCDAKYNNNYGTKIQRMKENAPKTAVSQYSLQGDFITSFESQIEAARQTGTRQGGIASCLAGKAKTANGYIWIKKD